MRLALIACASIILSPAAASADETAHLSLAGHSASTGEPADAPGPPPRLIRTLPDSTSDDAHAQELFAEPPVAVQLKSLDEILPPLPEGESPNGIQQVQYPFYESGAQNVDPAVPALPPSRMPDDACDALPELWHEDITSFTYTLIPASSQNVSWNSFDLRHVIRTQRFPYLQVTPRFSFHLVGDDPYVPIPNTSLNLTDISPQLYDFGIETTLRLPIGERWELLGSVAPSMFTDFYNTSSGAFRIPSRAIAFYQWSEHVKLAGGVLYLDRDDVSTAVVAGFIVGKPEDQMRLELLYPRMKVAYRCKVDGDLEHWIYIAQDFLGGGSWAMQHSYGLNDVVTYYDQKVLFGYERILAGRKAAFIEGGYVYDRELSFRELGYGELSASGVLRVGLIF
ncbi:hypothetical protein SAMN05421753_12152 [Planctomicrobium piriforme]|uniref:Uncharacterized protein n=2 Tax=Planctomicrobium piriforme TaxID=1576369 RepID=A0A1I3RL55_9PLAN|nr:hypothetical protein SAMN05421753_12152 [Planctomicrobium piriforme]